jgi:hypothetical protein
MSVCETKPMPILFVLPESFSALEFLPPGLRPFADDARYFVSLILSKFAARQVDNHGCVRLHAKFLCSVMNDRHYAAIVNALMQGGAVERSSYEVGRASFGYRLSARFLSDKLIRVPARDRTLIQRINRSHKRTEAESLARMKPVHHELARRQCLLEIESSAAERILAGLPVLSNPYNVQGMLIENIARRDFTLSVGKSGRVSNSITSLKRELRPALVVNGEPLACVDLSCAQAAMLANLIEKGFSSTNAGGKECKSLWVGVGSPPPSLSSLSPSLSFSELARSGSLYDFLQERLADTGVCMSRDSLKLRVLRDVFAKRKANAAGAEYPSQVEDIFQQHFPTVYAFIREFNRDGWQHENLIRELQRQESQFVVETVAADLLRTHPRTCFITLHDAIFAAASDLPKVKAAFDRGFATTGLKMKYKKAGA